MAKPKPFPMNDEQRLVALGAIPYRGYTVHRLYDGTISIEYSSHIIQRSCGNLDGAKRVIDSLLD